MKLPNGYGSVHKLSGKRRKPWRVRISDGYDYIEEEDRYKRRYKTLGYYESRQVALQALSEYNANPYDIDSVKVTLEDVYNKWSEEYFKNCTDSSKRTVTAAWAYCSILYKMRMKDIRVYHLKGCLEDAYIIPDYGQEKGKKRKASAGTRARMKSLFNLLFDYACEHEITDKNYARLFKIDEETKKETIENKKEVIPFSEEEIQRLWENVNQVKFADMILIDIYSGWRPQELSILQIEDIDLEQETMKGGMKTDAGRNRVVPIHPLIYPLIQKRVEEAKNMGSAYLFNDEEGQQGTYMTYDKYRSRFNKAMSRLKMKHRPHEARHTFITKAKKAGMDEYILKLIVGHAITDITENTYTHRTIEELKNEIRKIES